MPSNTCYHCGRDISQEESHDCWTTTEEALTELLPEDLMDAWLRLRETAVDFGEQRIYASHNSIMFARKTCYFFVRPKKSALEVWFFLGRTLKAPAIRKSEVRSRLKVSHLVHVTHRDEVEPPLTDWLREAYDVSETLRAAPRPAKKPAKASPKRKKRPAPKKRPPKKRRGNKINIKYL